MNGEDKLPVDRRWRTRGKTQGSRHNLWLKNIDLLREMCPDNYSWFVDELIAREHRKRMKKVLATQPTNNTF